MRTTIVIDDRLMKRAMRAAGTATKRATVERGLQPSGTALPAGSFSSYSESAKHPRRPWPTALGRRPRRNAPRPLTQVANQHFVDQASYALIDNFRICRRYSDLPKNRRGI
jgi:hypothetical protein